jgi:hypothetical protein
MKQLIFKTLLSISIVLGLSNIPSISPSYAEENPNEHFSSDSDSGSDSDFRGNEGEEKNIIICHVPKGNPSNKHTIHIAASAWPAHRDNHGGDYLGSCNNPPIPRQRQRHRKIL